MSSPDRTPTAEATPRSAAPSARGGDFDAVVFAGGGCRCAWQVGFWVAAAEALSLAPRRVAGTSAGAAMACMIFAGRIEAGLEGFKRRVSGNPRNLYAGNWLRGRPVFPHERIYRETILDTLDGEAMDRLLSGPDIRVLLARPPAWLGPRAAPLVGMLAHEVGGRLVPRIHRDVGRRVGFAPEVVSVRSCATAEEVADLILQGSCTPPVTPAYRRGGRLVLDGGLVDAVPVEALGDAPGRTLVLLTKPHPEAQIPRVPGRTYVGPSREIPVHKWDYTSAERVQETFDLGRRDGERFASGAC